MTKYCGRGHRLASLDATVFFYKVEGLMVYREWHTLALQKGFASGPKVPLVFPYWKWFISNLKSFPGFWRGGGAGCFISLDFARIFCKGRPKGRQHHIDGSSWFSDLFFSIPFNENKKVSSLTIDNVIPRHGPGSRWIYCALLLNQRIFPIFRCSSAAPKFKRLFFL